MVPQAEFLEHAVAFRFVDAEGQFQGLDLCKDTLAYTLCQVPIVAHRTGTPRIQVTRQDGSVQTLEGHTLDTTTSAAIFGRTGQIQRLDVFLGLTS